MALADLLTSLRGGLAPGENVLLRRTDDPELGIDFSVHLCPAGSTIRWHDTACESALLVIRGAGTLRVADEELRFDRQDWIEQGPSVAHGPAGCSFELEATTECEVARVALEGAGAGTFAPRLLGPAQVPTEHRGRGTLEDSSYRLVRCAFDRESAPPASGLVLGEVVNFPGRWSSYPPHHHPQPEIYYYRFAPARGYGHGELGDRVYQLRDHDLLRITGDRDHAQCAAPGYQMYYLWAIRHLPDAPYTGFSYNPQHAWLLDRDKETP